MEASTIPEDLIERLNEYDRIGRKIVEDFCADVDAQAPPDSIYHYTDDKGLKGILETGQLWLSDIFYLNDPSELSHGFSHVVNILNRKVENASAECQRFANHLAKFHQDGLPRSAHYFVCSFSSDGNDLGQWRAYADNGRGYALGFDAKGLEGGFVRKDGKPIPNNSTFHVTYDEKLLVDIHQKLVDNMFHLISLPYTRKLNEKTTNAFMRQLSVLLSMHALRSALFFKHPAYGNEKEYRFMEIHRGDLPPPEVSRRYRAYELIKYREFNWRQLQPTALKRIVVGPAADQAKAVQFAIDCMRAFHKEEVPVLCSDIPYRAS